MCAARIMRAMRSALTMILLAVLAFGTDAVRADDVDHEDLRRALERNELVPLRTLFDWIEARYEGRIIEVEMDDDDDMLIYEVEMLTPQGNKIEFEFDARNGALMSLKGRGLRDTGKRQ